MRKSKRLALLGYFVWKSTGAAECVGRKLGLPKMGQIIEPSQKVMKRGCTWHILGISGLWWTSQVYPKRPASDLWSLSSRGRSLVSWKTSRVWGGWVAQNPWVGVRIASKGAPHTLRISVWVFLCGFWLLGKLVSFEYLAEVLVCTTSSWLAHSFHMFSQRSHKCRKNRIAMVNDFSFLGPCELVSWWITTPGGSGSISWTNAATSRRPGKRRCFQGFRRVQSVWYEVCKALGGWIGSSQHFDILENFDWLFGSQAGTGSR